MKQVKCIMAMQYNHTCTQFYHCSQLSVCFLQACRLEAIHTPLVLPRMDPSSPRDQEARPRKESNVTMNLCTMLSTSPDMTPYVCSEEGCGVILYLLNHIGITHHHRNSVHTRSEIISVNLHCFWPITCDLHFFALLWVQKV